MKTSIIIFTIIIFSLTENSNIYGQDTTLTVTSDGKVGIGTTDPKTDLDIRGSNPDESAGMQLSNSDESHWLYFNSGKQSNPSSIIMWQEGDPLLFGSALTSFNELMRFSTNGNIGIGLNNPSYKLDVAGDINFTGTLYQNGSPFSSGGGSSLWSLNGNKIYYNNGYVGIGLDNPLYNLDVTGDINFTGTLYQNGSPFSSGGGSSLWSLNGNKIYYNNGNVGIGTNNPQTNLDVASTIRITGGNNEGGQLTFMDSDDEGGWELDNYGATGEESLRFFRDKGYNNIFDALLLTNSGNVGIGINSPIHKLDVAGKIGINGTQVLYLPDQIDFIGSLIIGNGGGDLYHSGFDYGWFNTAVGIDAFISNTIGAGNTAIGYSALNSNIGGLGNIAVGRTSLYYNTSGVYNVAVGDHALYSNEGGGSNIAVGHNSLYYNTTGGSNIAVGTDALHSNTSGEVNTAVGFAALHNNTSGSGNVCIGYFAGYSETGDNKLYIENSSSNSPLIWGDFGINHLVINGNSTHNINNRTFFVNGQAGGTTSWYNDSDERLKKNIITIPSALEKVNKMRGVNFEWKDTEYRGEGLQMGFIAQEVKDIIPEVVDNGGEYYSMQYAPITALLVEAVKDLSKENVELKNEIEQLKELVNSFLNKENE